MTTKETGEHSLVNAHCLFESDDTFNCQNKQYGLITSPHIAQW